MRDRSCSVQHMQKSQREMNIQLDSVLSDIAGKSGMLIMDAIVSGERDGIELAKLCDVGVKASAEEVAAALEDNWRREHLFDLRQALSRYRHLSAQMRETQTEIDRVLPQLMLSSRVLEGGADESIKMSRKDLKSPACTAAEQQLQLLFCQIFVVELTAVPGVSLQTVLTLLSEVGTDLSAFPSAAHFCSRLALALAPNVCVGGGKRMPGRGPHRCISSDSLFEWRQCHCVAVVPTRVRSIGPAACGSTRKERQGDRPPFGLGGLFHGDARS